MVVEAAKLFLPHGRPRIGKSVLVAELRFHIKILKYGEKFEIVSAFGLELWDISYSIGFRLHDEKYEQSEPEGSEEDENCGSESEHKP